MDLCAEEGAAPITVQDIAQRANITRGAVKGQLAGLTRVLRNPVYHFDQKLWPFRYSPLASGQDVRRPGPAG